jgi:hypothetical protein
MGLPFTQSGSPPTGCSVTGAALILTKPNIGIKVQNLTARLPGLIAPKGTGGKPGHSSTHGIDWTSWN